MDMDLITWVGMRLRFLGSLLKLPDSGWSFHRLCNLVDYSHKDIVERSHLARGYSGRACCEG
jgi:hypothetical protein